MSRNAYLTGACKIISALTLALFAIDCGSSTPTTPTNGTLASVALSTTSLPAGTSGVVTVTVTAAASTTTNVTLTSNNTAVATVPASLAIAAGATSATTTITAVAPGTAIIFAAANGSSAQSATLTITADGVALKSLSLSASTVVGGQSVTATVQLSAPAGASGATVALTGGDPVTVPASVSVPTGMTSATFMVVTRAVGGTIMATIGGTYGGGSATAMLAVTRPTVATAVFGVTGPTETDTCVLENSGNTINCTFNGSPSTAPGNIVEWDWTYGVSTMVTQTTTGPTLAMPSMSCAFLPPPPLPTGATWLTMTVTLVVKDDQGNVSPLSVDNDVRLFPQGSCGY